jgi:hypothetical protein
MMGQVGGKEAFEDGQKDLEVLAGVKVTTKAVERVSEATGKQIEQQNQREQKQILSGKVVPFPGTGAIPKMYIAMDGTGAERSVDHAPTNSSRPSSTLTCTWSST